MKEAKSKPQRDLGTEHVLPGNSLSVKHEVYAFLKQGKVSSIRGRRRAGGRTNGGKSCGSEFGE